MIHRLNLCLLIIILMMRAGQVSAADSLRLAILVGEGNRAPTEGIVDLLQAELSGRSDIVMVERQQIDQVLNEHELVLASAANVTQNIKLGRLLAAEAFVFIEQIPESKYNRLRLIETATGIVLGQVFVAGTHPDKVSALAAAALGPLMQKMDCAQDQRCYIGSIECRNESLQNELNPIADALAMLMSTQLSRAQDVILLDREQLQWLKSESVLTGAAQIISSAAIALNCGINQPVGEERLRLSVSIERTGGGDVKVVGVEIPRGDLLQASSVAIRAVLEALGGTQQYYSVPQDPKAEAAAYVQRASALFAFPEVGGNSNYFYFSRHSQHISVDMPIARRLCEAALALDPNQQYRWLAANTAKRNRALELYREYWQNELAALRERGIKAVVPDIWTFPIKPGLRPWGKDGVERLQPETIQLIRDCVRLELACKGYDGKKREYGEWWQMHEGAFHGSGEMALDTEEWVNYVKDLYSLYLAPPPRVRKYKNTMLNSFLLDTLTVGVLPNSKYFSPFRYPQQYDKLLELFHWLRQQGEPFVLYSYMLEAVYSQDQERKYAAMRQALDLHLEQDKAGHLYIRDKRHFDMSSIAQRFLGNLAGLPKAEGDEEKKWQEIRHYFYGFVDLAVERGDLRRIDRWLPGDPAVGGRMSLWQIIVEQKTDRKQALAWLDWTLEQIQRHKPDYYALAKTNPDWKPPLQCKLELVRARIRGDSLVQGPWQEYSIERLPTETQGEFEKIVHLGDCLLIVGQVRRGATGLRLFLQLYDFNQRKAIRNMRIDLEGVKNRSQNTVSDVLIVNRHLYVATVASGLVRFDLEDATAEPLCWNTDNQLPSMHITTMTALNGKIYCWAKRDLDEPAGKLVELDSRTLQWREILSSRSTVKHSELQTGSPFGINSICGDPARNCLWIAVQTDEDRRGLWRYSIAEGTAEKIDGQWWYTKLHWRQGKLGAWMYPYQSDLCSFDLDTGERSFLVGNNSQSKFRCSPIAFYYYDIIILDNHLLAKVGLGSVRLMVANSDDVPLVAPPIDGRGEFPVKSMVKIDDHTGIIATPEGELFEFKRKTSTPHK